MGEGTDPDGKEDSAAGDEERSAVAYEAGGLVSPDGEYQLSADDCAERAADAGDDYSQLAGIHPDVADRPAAFHGEHDVRLYVLSGESEGAVSEELVQNVSVCAVSYGARCWLDDYEYQGCDGGSLWCAERLCADSQVQREEEGREVAG